MIKTVKKQQKEFYNKKARFEYQIMDTLESGIVLTGDEIKAIRSGKVDITSSYAKIMNEEVFWLGANLNVGGEEDKQRTKKLLLHKDQIKKLIGKTTEKGYSLIPLKMYLTRGKAKLELGVGKGMKQYEKRSKLKERDIQKNISVEIKNRIK